MADNIRIDVDYLIMEYAERLAVQVHGCNLESLPENTRRQIIEDADLLLDEELGLTHTESNLEWRKHLKSKGKGK
jgi:hypothetical protein